MEILELLNEYFGTESKTILEFAEDMDDSGLEIPFHLYNFFNSIEHRQIN